MNELIQRLKHVRSIMLVIPDTPVKQVEDRMQEAIDIQQGIIDELLSNQATNDEAEPISAWDYEGTEVYGHNR